MIDPSAAIDEIESGTDPADPRELYLDLLKGCLTRHVFGDCSRVLLPRGTVTKAVYSVLKTVLGSQNLVLHKRVDPDLRFEGRDWPADAETMIGLKRLDNLQHCIADVLENKVPGDLMETGVWRGGATIFMRGVLKAYGDIQRRVWVADSFQGLPQPDLQNYPAEDGDFTWSGPALGISLPEVKSNFARYGLLDDRVVFLPGWFRDTLPNAAVEHLAVLRLDGDLYESTMIALECLYPKLSVGGYVIVDDYSLPACRAAVEDFRAEHKVTESIEQIDWTGVYWQRRQEAFGAKE